MAEVIHSFKQSAARTQILDLGTLAAGTYIAGAAVDLGVNMPNDVVLEVECDANGTPTGNKQLKVFVVLSSDGTNYTTGPTSGTTTTEEADLHQLGALPCNDTNRHSKMFSFAAAGVPLARYYKPVVFNDTILLTSGKVYSTAINGASN